MTRERAKELMPVIQAFADGKAIEIKTSEGWHEIVELNNFFYKSLDTYRIKPEPREFFAALYPQQGLRGGLFETKENAQRSNPSSEIIKVREILE